MTTTTPKIRSDNSDIGTVNRGQAAESENPEFRRIKEALGDRDIAWLSRETGIPASTMYDYSRKGISKARHAVKIARVLGLDLEWMLTGQRTPAQAGPVADSENSIPSENPEPAAPIELLATDRAGPGTRFVRLPHFRLESLSARRLEAPDGVASIPASWLPPGLSYDDALWLTELPFSATIEGVRTFMPAVCRSVAPDADLVEGAQYIFALDDRPILRRVSFLPGKLRLTSWESFIQPMDLDEADRNKCPALAHVIATIHVMRL